MDDLLIVSSLSKSFDGVTALADVSFTVPRGCVTGIVGGNGAGKSTLFDIIGGFEKANSGEVRLDGTIVTGWKAERLARHGCGIIRSFQEVRVFPNLSLLDNVLAALRFTAGTSLCGVFRRRAIRRELNLQRELADMSLRVVGLAGIGRRIAGELSYGQKKLLEIARCLAAPQKLLMLDEPFAGVHRSLYPAIFAAINLARTRGKTVLLIEHDHEVVQTLCERVVHLAAGRVLEVEDGRSNPPDTTDEVEVTR
jgi:ABC-type branched-subunit amino acid transport system ATPase component